MTKIYIAAPPFESIEVSEQEATEYLKCKFYHTTKIEAQRFYIFYCAYNNFSHKLSDPLSIIGILSEEYLLSKRLENSYEEIRYVWQSIAATLPITNKKLSEKKKEQYKKILAAIKDPNKKFSSCLSIDEQVTWGKEHGLVTDDLFSRVKSKIEHVRKSLFSENLTDTQLYKKICLNILKTMSSITETDLAIILKSVINFTDNYWDRINEGVNRNKIDHCQLIFTKEKVFDKNGLVQWLMTDKKILDHLQNDFPDQAQNIASVLAIKNADSMPDDFLTLEDFKALLKKHELPVGNIFNDLRYGRYRVYIDYHDALNSQASYQKTNSPFYDETYVEKNCSRRYLGLARLLNLNMAQQLLSGNEINSLNNDKDHTPIGITKEEYDHRIEIKLYLPTKYKPNRLPIKPENIRFIAEEVKDGLHIKVNRADEEITENKNILQQPKTIESPYLISIGGTKTELKFEDELAELNSHEKGVQYLCHLLENRDAILAYDLSQKFNPTEAIATNEKNNINNLENSSESLDQTHTLLLLKFKEAGDKKSARLLIDTIEDTKARLESAEESGEIDSIESLEDELNQKQRIYNMLFDNSGNPRDSTNLNQKAYRAIFGTLNTQYKKIRAQKAIKLLHYLKKHITFSENTFTYTGKIIFNVINKRL